MYTLGSCMGGIIMWADMGEGRGGGGSEGGSIIRTYERGRIGGNDYQGG